MTEQHEELSAESGLAKLRLIMLSMCSSTDHVHVSTRNWVEKNAREH